MIIEIAPRKNGMAPLDPHTCIGLRGEVPELHPAVIGESHIIAHEYTLHREMTWSTCIMVIIKHKKGIGSRTSPFISYSNTCKIGQHANIYVSENPNIWNRNEERQQKIIRICIILIYFTRVFRVCLIFLHIIRLKRCVCSLRLAQRNHTLYGPKLCNVWNGPPFKTVLGKRNGHRC